MWPRFRFASNELSLSNLHKPTNQTFTFETKNTLNYLSTTTCSIDGTNNKIKFTHPPILNCDDLVDVLSAMRRTPLFQAVLMVKFQNSIPKERLSEITRLVNINSIIPNNRHDKWLALFEMAQGVVAPANRHVAARKM